MTSRNLVFGMAGALGFLCAVFMRSASADLTQEIAPLPLPGPYTVACSNVTQDFSRMAPGEDVQNYWEGVPRSDGSSRYITDLLSDTSNTLALTVNAPGNDDVYGSFAGRSITFVVVVCYPTSTSNSRPDYPLPNGIAVPHMQRGADAPLLADPTTRFPLLLFSHGLLGSPLSNDYLQAMSIFASNGYVVAAPFHGDGRFSLLQPESLSDYLYLLTHLRDFNAMQALRPLSLSATIDLLLANPQWRDHLDANRIGGFGASLGGESMLLMAGAGLTTAVGMSWTKIINDTRLKAAVGYVPYFGQSVFPAFGRDQHGLDDVTLPYLAISGTADTTAPLAATVEGFARLAGPRELVALTGVKHGFDVASTNDIFTWSVTFLDGQIRGDAAALTRLSTAASVAGGGDDHVLFASSQPMGPGASANYGGLWWTSPGGSESGWGINLAHQGDTIFAAWFTYDETGSPLWFVMSANRVSEGIYMGTLYRTTGPAFNSVPFDAAKVVRTPVGTGTLTFTDQSNGTFNYSLYGYTRTKPITREVFGPVPVCTFGAQPNLALATNYQDMWWNPDESGWGISLTHQGNTIFAAWFTYDGVGKPLWLTVSATLTSQPGIYGGTLYRTSGPPYYAVPFDPAAVTRTPAGAATLSFADGNRAILSYSMNGITQSKDITRQVFQAPGTVCQ